MADLVLSLAGNTLSAINRQKIFTARKIFSQSSLLIKVPSQLNRKLLWKYSPIVFKCSAHFSTTPTECSMDAASLGATMDSDGGTTFKVWAPHADSAYVSVYDVNGNPGPLIDMERQGLNWATRVDQVGPGRKYHFVFEHNGQKFERRDARARQTDYDSNACYVIDPAYEWSPFTSPPLDEMIIYQLHVGAFTGRENEGGTFKALEKKLDYIRDLGFTAIQMLPVHEYCGSWGYNPRLLFSIHQRYGTPKDLKQLVDAAHKKGMAVIFDVVLNHAAAKMNSLWAYDGWNKNNGGGLYFEGGKDTPFGKSFAWWQKEVCEMVYDAAAMFLQEYNGDALRFDCVHVMPWKVLQKLTWDLHHSFPGKSLIAELTPESPTVIHDAGFDSTWMHSSYYDMRAFMSGSRSFRKLESLLRLHPGYSSPTQCVKYFLGSHDQTGCRNNGGYDSDISGLHRFVVELFGGRGSWDARAQARMWYGALIASSGVPMVFMGSEFHHSDWWGVNTDRQIRWDLASDGIAQEMMALVKSANYVRRGSGSLRRGSFQTLHSDESNCVIAFKRQIADERILIVVNASGKQWDNHSYGVYVGHDWAGNGFTEVFNSQAKEFGGWLGSGNSGIAILPSSDAKIYISLPKWCTLIFQSN